MVWRGCCTTDGCGFEARIEMGLSDGASPRIFVGLFCLLRMNPDLLFTLSLRSPLSANTSGRAQPTGSIRLHLHAVAVDYSRSLYIAPTVVGPHVPGNYISPQGSQSSVWTAVFLGPGIAVRRGAPCEMPRASRARSCFPAPDHKRPQSTAFCVGTQDSLSLGNNRGASG
jgi:hypothetical protein